MKLGSMLMKKKVLFNRSNSLKISEAKHTNGRAVKFSFLDHEELSHFEGGISLGDLVVQRNFQCTIFYCCIIRKWEPGEISSLRGVAVADH